MIRILAIIVACSCMSRAYAAPPTNLQSGAVLTPQSSNPIGGTKYGFYVRNSDNHLIYMLSGVAYDLNAPAATTDEYTYRLKDYYDNVATAKSDNAGGASEVHGTSFFFTTAASITGIRFYWGDTSAKTVRLRLWSPAGTSMAVTDVAVNGAGWYTGTFSVAQAGASYTIYTVSAWETGGTQSWQFRMRGAAAPPSFSPTYDTWAGGLANPPVRGGPHFYWVSWGQWIGGAEAFPSSVASLERYAVEPVFTIVGATGGPAAALPSSTGHNGQFLSTDNTGNLSWNTPSVTSVGMFSFSDYASTFNFTGNLGGPGNITNGCTWFWDRPSTITGIKWYQPTGMTNALKIIIWNNGGGRLYTQTGILPNPGSINTFTFPTPFSVGGSQIYWITLYDGVNQILFLNGGGNVQFAVNPKSDGSQQGPFGNHLWWIGCGAANGDNLPTIQAAFTGIDPIYTTP